MALTMPQIRTPWQYDSCPRCGRPKGKRSRQCNDCRYAPDLMFWPKVMKSIDPGGCWEWAGRRDKRGYGIVHFLGHLRAHQVAYDLLVGSVPVGLELDHLCRNPSCVNPAHLEAVTHQENILRGRNHGRDQTHCKHGHAFDDANTLRWVADNGRPRRRCRTCNRAAQNRRRNGR